ncbi:MAG: hypothetical protein AB1679_14630 [Actinomycetota bacterium]
MRRAGRVLCASGAAGVFVAVWGAPAAADVPGAGIVKDVVGGATGFTFGAIASGVASWVMGAVGDLVAGVVDYLGTSASPRLDAAWFSGPGSPFALVRNIAGTLLVGFVLLAVIQGLLAGDLAAAAGRVARDLVLAVVGMAAVVVVTVKLLELTDALSAAVLQGADAHAVRFLSGFGAAAADATGGFALVLIGLVVAVGALLVWVELLVRSALVYLLVALSPLAFAAMTWPAAKGVLRRTVELLLAVVVSKFVICVALALGAAALGGAGSADAQAGGVPAASLGTLLSGAAVLGLAAFSPFVVLRLIPFAEAAVAAHGVSRGPLRGAQAGAMAVYSGQSLARLAGAKAGGGAGAIPSGGLAPPAGSAPGRLAGPGTAAPAGDSAAPAGSPRAGAAAAQGRAGSRGDDPVPPNSTGDSRSRPPSTITRPGPDERPGGDHQGGTAR